VDGAGPAGWSGAPVATSEAAAALLELAVAAVAAAVRGGPPPALPDHPELQVPAGVFVSLHRQGALRGCLGRLESDRPLAEVTLRMAVAAAHDDPRFPPVSEEELEGLQVEVSVLSPLQPVRPEELVAGRDGVVVRRSGRQGVLLPQVATEQRWDVAALLRAACRKAGLAEDAWQGPGTELLAFRAQVIGPSR
jgi:AmmeMemoRadiSam system protein A